MQDKAQATTGPVATIKPIDRTAPSVVPPDFWTVDLDGQEIYVSTTWDQETRRIEIARDILSGAYRVEEADDDGADRELTEEEAEAVLGAIKAEVDASNLELLQIITRMTFWGNNEARNDRDPAGPLGRWRHTDDVPVTR